MMAGWPVNSRGGPAAALAAVLLVLLPRSIFAADYVLTAMSGAC
jgi:hypothetical protein